VATLNDDQQSQWENAGFETEKPKYRLNDYVIDQILAPAELSGSINLIASLIFAIDQPLLCSKENLRIWTKELHGDRDDDTTAGITW